LVIRCNCAEIKKTKKKKQNKNYRRDEEGEELSVSENVVSNKQQQTATNSINNKQHQSKKNTQVIESTNRHHTHLCASRMLHAMTPGHGVARTPFDSVMIGFLSSCISGEKFPVVSVQPSRRSVTDLEAFMDAATERHCRWTLRGCCEHRLRALNSFFSTMVLKRLTQRRQ